MAGIYIHVPFCKSRCIYCDFYSTTEEGLTRNYVEALCQELRMKSRLWEKVMGKNIPPKTLYFGGGTPSRLSADLLKEIFHTLEENYNTPNEGQEITIEANPDDITSEYAFELQKMGVNRISLGVQSFDDRQLKFLGRRHNSRQVFDAVTTLRQNGFENIGIDLIYGLPLCDDSLIEKSLQAALALHPEHISAYALSYEEGTRLSLLKKQGRITEKSDDDVAHEYKIVAKTLEKAGYRHYEISNFSVEGKESRHNSAYWKRLPYMGFGPAAHSYFKSPCSMTFNCIVAEENEELRLANRPDLIGYCQTISHGLLPIGFHETLRDCDIYNECIMLGLRTQRGISLREIKQRLGPSRESRLLEEARPFIEKGILMLQDRHLAPTEEGMFVIDGVIASLFSET